MSASDREPFMQRSPIDDLHKPTGEVKMTKEKSIKCFSDEILMRLNNYLLFAPEQPPRLSQYNSTALSYPMFMPPDICYNFDTHFENCSSCHKRQNDLLQMMLNDMENDEAPEAFVSFKSENWWIDEPNHPQQRFENPTNELDCKAFKVSVTNMIRMQTFHNPNFPGYGMTPWNLFQEHYRICTACQVWTEEKQLWLIGWKTCGSLENLSDDCYTFRYDLYKRLRYPKYRYDQKTITHGKSDEPQCIDCLEWLKRVKAQLVTDKK